MKSKDQVIGCFNRQLNLCDSTLRSGEQAAGVVFSNIERYRIAQSLDDAGIPQIEAGMPMIGGEEKKAVRHIARMGLNASVMAWNRADINDLNASIDADVDSVKISMYATDEQIQRNLGKDRQWAEDKLYESVAYAAEHGLYIVCNIADASQADLGSILDFAKVAMEGGADRLCYCDANGSESPFALYEKLKTLRQIFKMDFEIDARNDFGLATANTLAAIKAGAKFANVTSMGIGERAGCAPLEEVCLASKHLLDTDTGVDCVKLKGIAETVSLASGIDICSYKPIIGTRIFAQEAGVNVNGKVIDEQGQAYDPEEVGAARTVVIGKHSGSNTIVAELNQMGIELSREEATALLDMVRKACDQMHRGISQKELFLLYQDMMSGNDVFDDAPEQAE